MKTNLITASKAIVTELVAEFNQAETLIGWEQAAAIEDAQLSRLSDLDLYLLFVEAERELEEAIERGKQPAEAIEDRMAVLGAYVGAKTRRDTLEAIVYQVDSMGLSVAFKALNPDASATIRRALSGTIYQYIIQGEMLQDLTEESGVLILHYDNHTLTIDQQTGRVGELAVG